MRRPGTSPTSTCRPRRRDPAAAAAGPTARIELEPGRYDTILPPGAVADLMIYAYWSGRPRRRRRPDRLQPPGGGTRVGEQLSSRALTMFSDPAAPGHRVRPVRRGHRVVGSVLGVRHRPARSGAPTGSRTASSSALLQTRHSAELTGLAGHSGDRQPRSSTTAPGTGTRRRPHRRHGPGAAAHLPLVHPRGRPADAAAHRTHPRRGPPRRGWRGRRDGHQLPVQREPGRPARPGRRPPPRRTAACPASGATTSRVRRCRRCASTDSTCPR